MGKTKRKSSQPETTSVSRVIEPLASLQRLIQEFNNQGVIIGGIAASLLGQPRLTADLDAVILLSVDDVPRLIEAAAKQDMLPRIQNAKLFARKNRILLLRHQPSSTNIDISLGILPFEVEMVERSKMVEVGSLRLRLPTPEDLIILKAVAHRPKDLEDINAIALSHPGLDIKRIQFWVEQFGQALDIPDLWEKISRLL